MNFNRPVKYLISASVLIICFLLLDNCLYDGGRSIIDWKKLPFHITPKYDEMKHQLAFYDEADMIFISSGTNTFSNNLTVTITDIISYGYSDKMILIENKHNHSPSFLSIELAPDKKTFQVQETGYQEKFKLTEFKWIEIEKTYWSVIYYLRNWLVVIFIALLLKLSLLATTKT